MWYIYDVLLSITLTSVHIYVYLHRLFIKGWLIISHRFPTVNLLNELFYYFPSIFIAVGKIPPDLALH